MPDCKKLGFVVLGNLTPCLFYWNFSSKVSEALLNIGSIMFVVTVSLVFLLEVFAVVSIISFSVAECHWFKQGKFKGMVCLHLQIYFSCQL